MPELKAVSCPFCSLHCADLHLHFDGDRLVQVSPACSMAQKMYSVALDALAASKNLSSDREISQAVAWTRESSHKMVILCGDLHQEAVECAVQFARRQKATLVCEEDFTGSSLSLAMKQAGLISATLGELKKAVQQIICCTKDVHNSLPRIADFLGQQLINQAVYLSSEHALDAIRRMRLKQETLPDELLEIQNKIQAVECGLLLFDRDWLEGDHQIAAELLLWLGELNIEKRWYGLAIPPAANSFGVVESLLSLTGYPGNMRFQSDGVKYEPRTCTLSWLLQNAHIDLCYFLGTPHFLTEKMLDLSGEIPTLVLGPNPPEGKNAVWLPAALAGIDCAGSSLRLDGLPVVFQPVSTSHRHPIEDVLRKINGEVTV
ncbi:MAG: hypothetical protein ABFD58_06880 [Anaerolineaceae bacterium]